MRVNRSRDSAACLRRRRAFCGLAGSLLVAAFLPTRSRAEERVECSLEECIERAYETHPALKAGTAREANAEAILGEANAERFPLVDFEAAVAHVTGNQLGVLGGGSDLGATLPTVSGTLWRTTLGAEAPLFQHGYFITTDNPAQKIAQIGIVQESWKTRSVRTEVALAVAAAYFDVLKGVKANEVYEKYVKLVQSSYDLVKARFEQNLVSKNDLLLAEVRVATAKRDSSLVLVAGKRAERALCTAIGLEGECDIHVRDTLPATGQVESVEEMVSRARANDPNVKVLEFAVEAQKEATKDAKSQRYPSLSLEFSYVDSDDFDPPIAQRWVGAVLLEVPVFDFGRTKYLVAASQAKEVEQTHSLEASKLAIGQEVYDKHFTVRQLEIELELVGKQLEQAREALKLKQARFEQSLSPISEVHEAQSEILRLQITQIQDEYGAALERFTMKLLASGG